MCGRRHLCALLDGASSHLSHMNTLLAEILLEIVHWYFSEMKHASGQCCIHMSDGESVAEVLHRAGTARSDDWDAEFVMQTAESLIRKSLLAAVVVHRREENLASTTFLSLMSPFEESALSRNSATIQIASPCTIFLKTSIDGAHALLSAETSGNLGNEFWATYGATIDRYLVGTGSQQTFHITKFMNAATHGKRDADLCSYALHEFGEGATPLVRSRDIEIYEFIGTHLTVLTSEGNRITCIAEVDELHALHRLAILDIETRDNSFC